MENGRSEPMRTKAGILRRAICLAVLLMMSAGALVPASADQEVRFKNFNAIMKYIQENSPSDLDIGSVKLKPADLEKIADALPEGGKLRFSTRWCGTVISDTDELIDLNGDATVVRVSDLEILIRLVPGVKKIILSAHRNLSNDQMIPVIEKYPEIEFVWLINLGGAYRLASDVSAYSTNKTEDEGHRLKSEELDVLKYAKNLKALDLGHSAITSLDFLKGMDLEFLILSDNRITDISILAEMPHLQYLELFRNNITDISPLAACTELIDLNLVITKVTDLTPLDACTKLERLWMATYKQTTIPDAANLEHFKSTHPECDVKMDLGHPTGDGWRDHPRYAFYRNSFKKRVWTPFSEMDSKYRMND